jgi:hypothetical protein
VGGGLGGGAAAGGVGGVELVNWPSAAVRANNANRRTVKRV